MMLFDIVNSNSASIKECVTKMWLHQVSQDAQKHYTAAAAKSLQLLNSLSSWGLGDAGLLGPFLEIDSKEVEPELARAG